MPFFRTLALGVVALVAGAAMLASPALAQDGAPRPDLVGEFGDWELYTYDGQSGKVCFILSRPERIEPSDRDHGDVFFFVTSRPSDGVESEASVLVGYTFEPDSRVTVDIDGEDFDMFVDRDGAWIDQPADEARILAAMRAGRNMVVSGRSSRGTDTRYTFSLSGVTASTNRMREVCS